MFKNIKKKFKAFMTGKSGFSLVELIVVIAIMAVMAAVLAPSLLGYVERSRAQKDDNAFSEVVNSVQLSLADQDVYDEMLKYSAEQYSCYVDSDSPDDANKVDIKAGKYYLYNDNERQLDETVYKLDGVMRGVTITFAPDAAASNSATLDLIKGHVNKYLPSGKKTYGGLTGTNASPKLADIPESELYNSLRATIGDKISINSQTYRNSEYTVFISMGTTGGQEAAAQDAIKVWGQFSGTNLPEGSSVAGNTVTGSNEFKEPTNDAPLENLNHNDVIPEGGKYYIGVTTNILGQYTGASKVLNAGDAFPQTVQKGDIYVYGDYEYRYLKYYSVDNAWHDTDGRQTGWSPRVLISTKEEYGNVLHSINSIPIVYMHGTYFNCINLKISPRIPDTVCSMFKTYVGCVNLVSIQNLPNNLERMEETFANCTSLNPMPTIGSQFSKPNIFKGCTQFGY